MCIRDSNYGWADGFKLNMPYWEIWNEPDLDPDDSQNKRTWGGTKAQFFELYETAAKHLKSCFPEPVSYTHLSLRERSQLHAPFIMFTP